MPKMATKAADSVFYKARMAAAKWNDQLSSREGAAEVTGLDRTRIAYIELGTTNPYPEEILILADSYNAPELCNHYCSRMCPIGCQTIEPVEIKELEAATLQLLSSIRGLPKITDNLIDIVEDGKVGVNMAENVNERVISTIESPVVLEERSLKTQIVDMEVRADALVVTNDEEYRDAAEFLTSLKTQAGKVKDFFKPIKDAAHKAHKEVCDREKLMLDPLTKAEKAIKKALGDYEYELECKRKAAEERARQAAKAEAERRLAEAVELENQGKLEEAAAAAEEAEIIDGAEVSIPMALAPRVKGVSSSKDWEITSIDLVKVPTEVAGTVIRPVDEKAVMRLIRASKGTIKIPGITYKVTMKMSARRA